MTIYADNRPITDTEICAEFGLLQPEPAEYVAYLLELGEIGEAYEVQQRQIREGRQAAYDGEYFCAAWPVATRTGYVEALQDMEK